MAEERNIGLARARNTEAEIDTDDDVTKADLQRRMDEARESISQTVSEIKDTVATQYQNVKENLDWREQFRRRPGAFAIGALSAGLLLGYSVGGALGGDSDDEDDDENLDEYTDYEASPSRSYAAQAITSGGRTSSYRRNDRGQDSLGTDYEESSTPGLLSRFKETGAYDRLQSEISNLGSRLADELSHTAQNVVLPALLSKVKDFVGVDLSTQRETAQRSSLERQATTARAGAASASNDVQDASHSQQQGY